MSDRRSIASVIHSIALLPTLDLCPTRFAASVVVIDRGVSGLVGTAKKRSRTAK